MFDRFTDRARNVMNQARLEAQKFNHEYIGTEHLLLGIVDEGSGVAMNVLRRSGVDPTDIRREIERLVQHGPPMVTLGQLPFTPRMKRVLALSVEESSGLGHNYIGTEHLLLAILNEGGSDAARILFEQLGCRIEDVRAEVLEFITPSDRSSVSGQMHQLEQLREEAKKFKREMDESVGAQDFERAAALRHKYYTVLNKLKPLEAVGEEEYQRIRSMILSSVAPKMRLLQLFLGLCEKREFDERLVFSLFVFSSVIEWREGKMSNDEFCERIRKIF